MHILYSFRRCPYAMRARMAIAYSNLSVEIREVVLKDKPDELVYISPKATVPVLLLDDGTVLEESLDIMYWALTSDQTSDIHLVQYNHYLDNALILENDDVFKDNLDRYKYADRYPAKTQEHDQLFYRQQGEVFLLKLETILAQHPYLHGDKLSVVDYAIFPFIRQFAHVDKPWFDQSQYKHLKIWLNEFLTSAIFIQAMNKYTQWQKGDDVSIFPSYI